MGKRCRYILGLLLFAACGGASSVTLEDLASEPKGFELGNRVLVEGFAIRPPDSVTFLCDEISDVSPPKATGRCVEVEGVPLTEAGKDLHEDRTWWDPEERSLDCLVVRFEPIHSDPERLVLSCVPDGSRP